MGREESTTEVTANDAVPGWAVVLVELLLDVLRDVLLHGVPIERLTERTREREKNPQTPTKNQLAWGQRGPAMKTKSRAGGKEEREGGHAGRTMRAISKASCRISSFMSALLSWILCAAAAAAAGGGDPAPTGLRSSEEAWSTGACCSGNCWVPMPYMAVRKPANPTLRGHTWTAVRGRRRCQRRDKITGGRGWDESLFFSLVNR